MESQTTLKETETAMEKAVEHMRQEFSSIRTGKASPALVENLNVHVSAYGSTMQLKGLAVITAPEPRTLTVQPFDPSTIQDIDRAIRESNLGLNPVSDGRMLRLPIPELSGERRAEMVKTVKSMSENGRIQVRACRKDGMDAAKLMKAENVLSEDGQRDFENDVQALTDRVIKKIDELTVAKEKEIITV